ncbi:hypothetical protein ACHMW5_10770 [Azospirillum melinis]
MMSLCPRPGPRKCLTVGRMPPFWQTVTLFNPVVYPVSGLA